MVPKTMPRRRFWLVQRNGEHRLVYTQYGDSPITGTITWLFHTHFPRGFQQGAIEIVDDIWEVGTVG